MTVPIFNLVKSGENTQRKKASVPRKTARKKSQFAREGKLFLKAFGDRVRELREKEGMSQDQLGYECGVSRLTILRIENGHYETGIASLALLAKVLGVEVTELVDFKKPERTSETASSTRQSS